MTAFILAVIVNSYNTGQASVTPRPHPPGARGPEVPPEELLRVMER